jgi:hypothetical protein
MKEGDALTLDARRKRIIANNREDEPATVVLVYVPPPL